MAIRDLIPWSRQENRLPVPVNGERDTDGHPLLSLHREVNRLFDDVFRGFGVTSVPSFDRSLGLSKREPRVLKKGAARGSQFDAAHAARHQSHADLLFEVAHLTAERRLRGVQPLLGRDRQAPLVGDGDKIAKMPELHPVSPYL